MQRRDHVVQGVGEHLRRRVDLPGAHNRQPRGDPPRGGDHEVPGPDRRVTARHCQQSGLWVVLLLGRVEHRVQRGVEHQLDQLGRRVVAAGGLSVVAGRALQRERLRQGVAPRDQLQQ